jgi:hypothetical protein
MTVPPAPTKVAVSAHNNTDESLAKLSSPLKLPDSSQLTRSQRLFSIATQTDIRSLTIKGDVEFYLFMDMRAEKQWASFNMTSHRWLTASQEYNARLRVLNEAKNCLTIKKNPRALMKLLGDVEARISDRIIKGDFICKSHSFPIERSRLFHYSSQENQHRILLEGALLCSAFGKGRVCQ